MEKHPIDGLMKSTMESIRDMVDVNTVVGDAVQTADGSTVIPISRVSFGFVSGGAEYTPQRNRQDNDKLPFGGGSGAGVSGQPMGFLVIGEGSVRMLSARCDQPAEKLMELIPQITHDIREIMDKRNTNG